MKARTSFVSNSSSSSFVVTKEHYMKTIDVAIEMLKDMIADRYASDYEDLDRQKKYLDIIRRLRKEKNISGFINNFDCDIPIYIPFTINYNTFIWRHKNGNIHVITSNNHDWFTLNLLEPVMRFEDSEKEEYRGDREDRYTYFKKNLIETEKTFLNLNDFKMIDIFDTMDGKYWKEDLDYEKTNPICVK